MIFFCPFCRHSIDNNDPTQQRTLYGRLECTICENVFNKLNKFSCGCCLCYSCITKATPEVIVIDSSDDELSISTQPNEKDANKYIW